MLIPEMLMFFVSKRLSLLTAFVCWPPESMLELVRSSSTAGVRVRVVPPSPSTPHLSAVDLRRQAVLLDASCPHAERLLAQASEHRSFNLVYTWLILQPGDAEYNQSSLTYTLGDLAILPDADVTWVAGNTLVDIYRVKATEPLLTTTWQIKGNSSLEGLQEYWAKIQTTVVRRKDLHNVFITAGTVVSQPQHFKGWSDMSSVQIDTFPKLTYPLMMLLRDDLNFRYNLRQGVLYGEAHNGSFDGLAGQLQRQEVELGINTMFMRGDRWDVLHFVVDAIEVRGSFLFRQPVQAAVRNVFVLPFTRGAWAAAAGCVAAAGAALGLLAPRDPGLGRVTAADIFTFAIATICQQGSEVTPSRWSARLVVYSSLLLALFAFTSYSAKIVSILQAPSDALRTIADLERSSIAVAVQDTTYRKVYFAESTDPVTQRLYRKKLLPLGDRAYMSVIDGIARVRTEFFAFQVEEVSGYDIISKTYTEREKCGLQTVQAFRLPMTAVPIAKYSGYKELVAVRLRWQRENGLRSQVVRKWLAPRPRCDNAGAGADSISLLHVLPCVQVLCLGALLSIIILAAEYAVFKYKSKQRRKAAKISLQQVQ